MTHFDSLESALYFCEQTVAEYFDLLLAQQVLPDNDLSHQLIEAARYVTLKGGKRLRPLLVYLSAQAIDPKFPLDALVRPAIAVESIHCYSLVHDDLPAMDDDDLRRGRPTCHIAFNEAEAILVGDALQSFAFELISLADPFSAKQRLDMLSVLSQAIGFKGMVLGQSLDLYAENKSLTLDQLSFIHRNKTGALIKAAVLLGAHAASASANQLKAMTLYAEHIGLAFQIKDDLLDVESDTQTLGKVSGADAKHCKSTYPQILGLTEAKRAADRCVEQALSALADAGIDNPLLIELAVFITNRKR